MRAKRRAAGEIGGETARKQHSICVSLGVGGNDDDDDEKEEEEEERGKQGEM